MAAPLPTQDVLGLFKALKDDLQATVLGPRGLSIKSSGTKVLPLGEAVSTVTGFWQNPQSISNKPPRWIPQVVERGGFGPVAQFALDAAMQPFQMGKTVGYINNRDGTCAVCAFRVMPAVQSAAVAPDWVFPAQWEYLLFVAFSTPLPAGTSGDPLSNFNPVSKTVDFGGGASRATFPFSMCAIVMAPIDPAVSAAVNTTYCDVGAALAQFTGAGLYDGALDSERDRMVADLNAIFVAASPQIGPFTLAEDTALVGMCASVYRQIEAAVNSGKRHIILYGPPGTGKTTLAEYLAREVSEHEAGDGSYLMLTASSAWSQQDLVGGYQPLGGGAIGFIPGALLRNFHRPTIIDELNRCPIDKVLGPMFSILSGQSSVLPCRVDASDPASPFHVIHPVRRPGMSEHEHAPEFAWRLICTLNTYDKTQLGQISYALSRRFAWIKVGAPADPDGFVTELAVRSGFNVPAVVLANPVGAMWKAVNAVREIGGAPIVDFIRTLRALQSAIDLFALPTDATAEMFLSVFRMCVLPLMDGLSPREASDLATGISTVWSLNPEKARRLALDCAEFSA